MTRDIPILGEPTGGLIEAGCQGTLRIRVHARGVRAHSARSWLGDNAVHRLAPVLGALFLVVADLMARIVVPPQEIPLGAITAAVGVPVFLGLMQRRRTRIDS